MLRVWSRRYNAPSVCRAYDAGEDSKNQSFDAACPGEMQHQTLDFVQEPPSRPSTLGLRRPREQTAQQPIPALDPVVASGKLPGIAGDGPRCARLGDLPRQRIQRELANGERVELQLSAYPHTDWQVGVDLSWARQRPLGKAEGWLKETLQGTRCSNSIAMGRSPRADYRGLEQPCRPRTYRGWERPRRHPHSRPGPDRADTVKDSIVCSGCARMLGAQLCRLPEIEEAVEITRSAYRRMSRFSSQRERDTAMLTAPIPRPLLSTIAAAVDISP